MTEREAGPPVQPTRMRILLVEDDTASGRGLCRLLEARGYAVTVVPDGASAVAALRAVPPPDFVLSDLQLPDLDGREIARFARTLDPAPRVALITGWDLDLSSEERSQLGIEWILPKPLHVPDLVNLLNEPRKVAAGAEGPPEA